MIHLIALVACALALQSAPGTTSANVPNHAQALFLSSLSEYFERSGQALPTRWDASRTIPVRVWTREDWSTLSAKVPGIAFRVLQPVVKASELMKGEAILAGATDERGEAIVRLPLAAFDLRRPGFPRVRLHVSAPGMVRHFGELLLERNSEHAAFVIRLVAKPGKTTFARLFDPQGNPTGDRYQLRARYPEKVTGSTFQEAHQLQMLADGWVLLHDVDPSRIHLKAMISNVGTGVWAPLVDATRDSMHDATEGGAHSPLALHLQGSGVVAGVVRNPAGNPVENLTLSIFFVRGIGGAAKSNTWVGSARDWVGGVGPGGPRNWLESGFQSAGLRGSSTATDRKGLFSVSGLEPGIYRVSAIRGDGAHEELEPVLVDSTKPFHSLLQNKVWVDMRLEGSKSSIFKPPARESDWFEFLQEPAPVRSISHPSWLVHASPIGASKPWAYGERLAFLGSGTDGVPFFLEAGRTYVACAVGPDWISELREIHIQKDGTHHPLIFEEPKSKGSGQVVLTVTRTAGLAAPPMGNSGSELLKRFNWRVVTDPYGITLLDGSGTLVGDSLEVRSMHLPQGSYRLIIEEVLRTRGSEHSLSSYTPSVSRSACSFRVQADSIVPLDLSLGKGGTVQLSLLDSKPELEWMGKASAHSSEPGARVFLRRPNLPDLPLWRLIQKGLDVHDDKWPLEASNASIQVPVGTYTLIGELPSGRRTKCTIHVQADQETEARLRF